MIDDAMFSLTFVKKASICSSYVESEIELSYNRMHENPIIREFQPPSKKEILAM